MRKRALWIFDESYAMLTYLSVCSFIKGCDAIVTLIWCGGNMTDDEKMIFEQIDAPVEIYHFSADVSIYEEHLQSNILNRLARLHYTRMFSEDLLFMIDSDVAFGDTLSDEMQEIDRYFYENENDPPLISGVVEFLAASDAYLYFKKKDKNGFTRKTPSYKKTEVYNSIYGKDWAKSMQGFQYNNGFLIFYRATKLIDQWERYYLEGLKYAEVNPLDDQVPLAAAIQNTKCRHWLMPPKWNSLGDLQGPFVMFHAWGGEWKIEIDQVLRNKTATSTYGQLIKPYLPDCPQKWITQFNENLKSFPYRYRYIQGTFDHGTVFTDLMRELTEGHIVEVGTYKGRSACFLAELIKNQKKDIRFDTVDHFERADTSYDLVQSNLARADVSDYVNVIQNSSLKAARTYATHQLDFVFLDTDSEATDLEKELEIWYAKVKPGGILAGYDHTIHDTIFQSYHCVTAAFCQQKRIPLRSYEYQFIIQKPQ